MHAAHLVPELALARVVSAGGPYRPGDDLSLAFTTPTVSRLVAHDAALRAKCVPLERALVPETIAVVITHGAAPYASGEVLTLSFVDPRVARIHESLERQRRGGLAQSLDEPIEFEARGGTLPAEVAAQSVAVEPSAEASVAYAVAESSVAQAPAGTQSHAAQSAPFLSAKCSSDETLSREPTVSDSERLLAASDLGVSYSFDGAMPPAIHLGERMTLRDDALGVHDAANDARGRRPATHDVAIHPGHEKTGQSEYATGKADSQHVASARTLASQNCVTVRLEWTSERLRRFVQVVDKLFTIDRLGWYRHSLAMRLLIPDEIACGDMLASVEAMRHLQALRAAAVESLGKPLLAACMPGFNVSSEWLESLESSREARAIAGLREALLPYANDGEEPAETPPGEALWTSGTIVRRELLAENATSAEAFLPLLIPIKSHDAALSVRLAEYRRLLVELFAQTARAGEPVRLHQMAQPNHSLDDRLWQLVGTAAEVFGGFAHA